MYWKHVAGSGALQCLHTQWEPMQASKERLFCRNVTKSGGLGWGYKTCWKIYFLTHYVGESQHFQGPWEEEIHGLYKEGNKWSSFIVNHWHFQKHLIWCLKWHSVLCEHRNDLCTQYFPISMCFTGYTYTTIMHLEMLCPTSDPLAAELNVLCSVLRVEFKLHESIF
jgi:hypothetical protein